MSNLYNKLAQVTDGRRPSSPVEYAKQLISEGVEWGPGVGAIKRMFGCDHIECEEAWDHAVQELYYEQNK